MPSSLSYSTGYLGASKYQVPFTRTDLVDPINKDVFDGFSKYQESIEAQKRKREEERQKMLAEHKQMRSEVDAASTVNLYDGDYALYKEMGNWLMSDEVINQYASTQEGMAQWESMVQQYHDAIGLGEQYYQATWGSAEEQEKPTLSTYNSAYFRSLTPEVNFYEGMNMTATTTWDQIEANYQKLQSQYHVPGSMRFENGSIVYDTIDGRTVALGTEQRDMKVFDPNLSMMDVSGYQYFTKVDNGKFENEDQVRYHIEDAVRDPSGSNFKLMLEHYLRNADFAEGLPRPTFDEVMNSYNPDAENTLYDKYVPDAIEMWKDEAVQGWRKPKSTTPRTNQDVVAARERKALQEKIDSSMKASRIVNTTGSPTSTPRGGVFDAVMTSDAGKYTELPGATVHLPFPLKAPIQIKNPNDPDETIDLTIGAIKYDALQDKIFLSGTSSKMSTSGVPETFEESVEITNDNYGALTAIDQAIMNEFGGMSLKDLFIKFAEGDFEISNVTSQTGAWNNI